VWEEQRRGAGNVIDRADALAFREFRQHGNFVNQRVKALPQNGELNVHHRLVGNAVLLCHSQIGIQFRMFPEKVGIDIAQRCGRIVHVVHLLRIDVGAPGNDHVRGPHAGMRPRKVARNFRSACQR